MVVTLESLVAEFHEHFTRNANDCVRLGVTRHLGELPDPSNEACAAHVTEATALLAQFEALDKSPLDFDAALDAELAALMLRRDIHVHTYTFNGKTQRSQLPHAGEQIGEGIFLLFANDPRDANERLDDITSRITAVPRFLDQMLARLDTPVARWVGMDRETVEGLPQLFSTIVDWAKTCNYSGLDPLTAACDKAGQALAAYVVALEALPTTTQLHVGDEVARTIVSLRGIDKSLEELHEMARSFLAETQVTIEALRSKLVAKYDLPGDTSSPKLQKYLSERYRVELPTGKVEDILSHYYSERDNIREFIDAHDLFPVLKEQDMNIMRTPPFMAPTIPAGAMMSPPPFRDGVRTSMVYLTLSHELVDEHTLLTIPGMMVHEGIPGHHLQLATASTHSSVVRRHIDAAEHAEGWTTMLEDYMLDVGYKAELTDEMRFCGKRDLSRIGARVAIDLFFMTGNKKFLDVGVECDLSSDDPFVAAGNLLQAVTGFVPNRVHGELNWYSQERGYPLSYLTGNVMVWQLKADVVQTLTPDLDEQAIDRRFHAAYLRSGNMPLTFLRRVMVNDGLIAE